MKQIKMDQAEEVVVLFQLLLLIYKVIAFFQLKEVLGQRMEEEEVLEADW